MKNIIFIAPPAAGKGTQSKLLNEKYNIPHISTGDLLREEISKGTDLGNKIAETMNTGSLISDDIVLGLLEKRLKDDDTNKGFILDGFPRNTNQAIILDELLEKLNKKIDYVIVLDLDREIAKKRIIGRLSCPKCGAIYNELFEELKPLNEGICNIDETQLIKRADDNETTFDKRYDTYIEQTSPLIDYYSNKGLIYNIDSSISKEYTFKQIEDILNIKE